jgi:hypothetical protein
MYQRVNIILWKSASEMLSLIIVERISWTPSCSKGSKEVRRGFSNENHTAFAKLQWKYKCESFSRVAWGTIFSYLGRKILSLSSSGSCSSDKSPNKSFYIRRKDLWVHIFLKMSIARLSTLLEPWLGRCTYIWELRSLKASLAEQTPFIEGRHLMTSMLSEGTARVRQIAVVACW